MDKSLDTAPLRLARGSGCLALGCLPEPRPGRGTISADLAADCHGFLLTCGEARSPQKAGL